MVFSSPFGATVAAPGRGEVVLSVLSPSIPALTTLTYKYPLKLLSRSPGFQPEQSVVGQNATQPVHLYLLTYGGGLLPGDHIDVSISLKPKARLVVTTPQGSTKIFKTPPEGRGKGDKAFLDDDMSRQTLKVDIGSEAGLCYLVDPSAPFKDSRYEQIQIFTLDASQTANRSSLCVLDWVTQGRSSRGENWDFQTWKGRNEVWTVDKTTGKRQLLLRDALILDNETARQPQDAEVNFKCGELLRERTYPHGVLGTLILYGPMFDQLGSFFMDTFSSQPRIGGRNWSATTASIDAGNEQNKVTWTSARVRAGFVLVKFGAQHLEAAREWLGNMLWSEGSIAREFGEEALFCL